MKSTNSPLKVGFDLDGVILYNPARVIRPLIAWVKKSFLKKTQTSFRIPQSRWEKIIVGWLHKSSLFIDPGYSELKRLVNDGKIEAYLITGRFKYLKTDFNRWLDRLQARKVFKSIHLNDQNLQPHLFKAGLIQKYHLDYFIDDNWDIITHLNQGLKRAEHHALPIWIYNLLDRSLPYPRKHPHLRAVMRYLEQKISHQRQP